MNILKVSSLHKYILNDLLEPKNGQIFKYCHILISSFESIYIYITTYSYNIMVCLYNNGKWAVWGWSQSNYYISCLTMSTNNNI